jgi:phosphatidylserine decarboxylase
MKTPALLTGFQDVPGGSNIGLVAMIEATALMIGEGVQCYSRERYENPQPILPGILIERGCPKSRYRPGDSADVLIFQGGRISFDEDIIVNRDRRDVQSRFSLGFGQPLVEPEVAVRSQIAKKIHHKIHKIT